MKYKSPLSTRLSFSETEDFLLTAKLTVIGMTIPV